MPPVYLGSTQLSNLPLGSGAGKAYLGSTLLTGSGTTTGPTGPTGPVDPPDPPPPTGGLGSGPYVVLAQNDDVLVGNFSLTPVLSNQLTSADPLGTNLIGCSLLHTGGITYAVFVSSAANSSIKLYQVNLTTGALSSELTVTGTDRLGWEDVCLVEISGTVYLFLVSASDLHRYTLNLSTGAASSGASALYPSTFASVFESGGQTYIASESSVFELNLSSLARTNAVNYTNSSNTLAGVAALVDGSGVHIAGISRTTDPDSFNVMDLDLSSGELTLPRHGLFTGLNFARSLSLADAGGTVYAGVIDESTNDFYLHTASMEPIVSNVQRIDPTAGSALRHDGVGSLKSGSDYYVATINASDDDFRLYDLALPTPALSNEQVESNPTSSLPRDVSMLTVSGTTYTAIVDEGARSLHLFETDLSDGSLSDEQTSLLPGTVYLFGVSLMHVSGTTYVAILNDDSPYPVWLYELNVANANLSSRQVLDPQDITGSSYSTCELHYDGTKAYLSMVTRDDDIWLFDLNLTNGALTNARWTGTEDVTGESFQVHGLSIL